MSESPKLRNAASLLLLRQGETEAEVLMGARAASHRFMPNRLVFPGGAVDTEDFIAPVAREAPAAMLLRLAPEDPPLARALAHAAARELEEETGLHLGVPPDLSGFDYLCRAITPPSASLRFDARFIVVDAAMVDGTLAGSGELEMLRWFGVSEALALDLAFPTRKVLEQFTLWLARHPAERRADLATPTLRDRTWHEG